MRTWVAPPRSAQVKGANVGLGMLDALEAASVDGYQPYWAVRAHLLREAGRQDEAVDAFDRAIALADDPAIRDFLRGRRDDG